MALEDTGSQKSLVFCRRVQSAKVADRPTRKIAGRETSWRVQAGSPLAAH
jgi:hypothetical protein